MTAIRGRFLSLLLSLGLCAAGAVAQTPGVIDFESLPSGGAPADGMAITNQYVADYGVSFEIVGPDSSLAPRIAKVGPPYTAFIGPFSTYAVPGCEFTSPISVDMPASEDEGVGCSFLTSDPNCEGCPLRVTYLNSVDQCSGVLVDIDNVESWTINAFDSGGAIIDSVHLASGDPGTGDGIATEWSFDHATADIKALEFVLTGTTVGLAFDRFSPSSLATPAETLSWSQVKRRFH